MGTKRSRDEHKAPRKRLPPAAPALRRRLREHERAEKELAAVNADLRRRIAEGERLESERRAAERRLHEVHARFESAFANAPIGMALVDMEGRWLQVNDALCRITGHTRAALKATTLRALTHPEDVALDADSLRELLDGRIPSYQIEKRYRHAWGHYLWGLLTVSLVRDDRGKALYVLSQVQDISERKELAQRLEYLIDHDFLKIVATELQQVGLNPVGKFRGEVEVELFGHGIVEGDGGEEIAFAEPAEEVERAGSPCDCQWIGCLHCRMQRLVQSVEAPMISRPLPAYWRSSSRLSSISLAKSR